MVLFHLQMSMMLYHLDGFTIDPNTSDVVYVMGETGDALENTFGEGLVWGWGVGGVVYKTTDGGRIGIPSGMVEFHPVWRGTCGSIRRIHTYSMSQRVSSIGVLLTKVIQIQVNIHMGVLVCSNPLMVGKLGESQRR